MDYLPLFKYITPYYKKFISVHITPQGGAFCTDTDDIYISREIMQEFAKNNLPRLCVFYHEMGHALYSASNFTFLDMWKKFSRISLKGRNAETYNKRYLHLDNWVEDYYIEQKLLSNYPYLYDIVGCLRKIDVGDTTSIDKVFHYYYQYKKVSPALTISDGVVWKEYLDKLLKLRDNPKFGKGTISLVSKNNVNYDYMKTLIEFYKWCQSKGIFPEDVVLPPLTSPINQIKYSSSEEDDVDNDMDDIDYINEFNGNIEEYEEDTSKEDTSEDNNISEEVNTSEKIIKITDENVVNDNSTDSRNGSYTDHGKPTVVAEEVFPEIKSDGETIFAKELATEITMARNIDNSYAIADSVDNNNLNGLFSGRYDERNIITNKPIIKNFFNPRKIEEGTLFNFPKKTYQNVSIYRDISGSTYGSCFKTINEICKILIDRIPIEYNFYLYGDEIAKEEFKDWEDGSNPPYDYNLIKVIGTSTNSDCIADVITEQMSDRWLNIIITDGDLYRLFERDNIESLLNNIAIISVGCDIITDKKRGYEKINLDHYIYVPYYDDGTVSDDIIFNIINMLNNFKEE